MICRGVHRLVLSCLVDDPGVSRHGSILDVGRRIGMIYIRTGAGTGGDWLPGLCSGVVVAVLV